MSTLAPPSPVTRESELRAAHKRVQRRHLDYLFTGFLQYEWLLALAVTIWLSREAGISVSFTLRQEMLTLFLGALLAIVPALFVWRLPGRRISRCVIAIAQMLFSGFL